MIAMLHPFYLFAHSLQLTLAAIRHRPIPYISAFIGFMMVMAVATVALGMFTGLQNTVNKSGSDFVALIDSPQGDGISESIVRDLYQVDAISRNAQGPLLMRLFGVPIQVVLDGHQQFTNIGFLGVDASFQEVWNTIHIEQGQTFRSGTNEIIVGRRLSENSPSILSIGKKIEWNNQTWTVVGIFTSNGDRRESQIIGDQTNLRAAYHQNSYSGIYARLKNPDGISEIKDFLRRTYGSGINVQSEREVLGQSGGLIKIIILIIGSITVGLMSIGSVIGGINIISMLVSDRAKEIGMLKALGFQNSFIFCGTLGESLMISLSGAAMAFAAVKLIMQDKVISTSSNGSLFSFNLHFDMGVFLSIMAFALLLGTIGGLIPALRATSIHVADTMNANH